jgi:hypothetical protein
LLFWQKSLLFFMAFFLLLEGGKKSEISRHDVSQYYK